MMLKAPCRADPISWDLDPGAGTPHPPVDQLIHACVSQCPMLERCVEYDESLREWERPYGVVAGVYRPWPGDSIVTARSTSTLVMRAVAHLGGIAATLGPGGAMPTLRKVVDDLGMSRNTVRAAFLHLVAERLLDPPKSRTKPYTVAEPRHEEDAA